jgi:hypothetical protein
MSASALGTAALCGTDYDGTYEVYEAEWDRSDPDNPCLKLWIAEPST